MRVVSQRGQQLLWSVFSPVKCLAQPTFGGEFLSSNAGIDITHNEPGKYGCLNHVMRILV